MPVATTALAVAGLGMSAAQFISAQKAQKQANNAATSAANEFSKIKEQNAFSAVQVPTLGFDLAQQGIDRQTAASVNALQGVGAEGVIGGIGTVARENNQAELELASQANEAKYQRDTNQAEAQSLINAREVIRKGDLLETQLEGAQAASAEARANKMAAIEGMVGSAGTAVSSGITASKLYRNKKLGGVLNPKTGLIEYPEGTFDEFGNVIKKSKNPLVSGGAETDPWANTGDNPWQ
jgi:hypothetical protein